MANVRLTPEQVSSTERTPTFTAIDATDTYLVNNDARVMLYFKNTSGGAAIITIQTPRTVDGNAIAEKTLSISATTGEEIIGNFSTDVYNDLAVADLKFTCDVASGVTVAVLRF